METTTESCQECGAYHGHSLACSRQTVEELRQQVFHYHAAWLQNQQRLAACVRHWQKEVTLWQGKCALLRHENNKLRRNVAKQHHKEAAP